MSQVLEVVSRGSHEPPSLLSTFIFTFRGPFNSLTLQVQSNVDPIFSWWDCPLGLPVQLVLLLVPCSGMILNAYWPSPPLEDPDVISCLMLEGSTVEDQDLLWG